MRQACTEDDIREVQSVFCASPDVLARDRLSQSKEKSARTCVSVDSSRSQLLSGDNTVTAGTLRDLSAILQELKAPHHPNDRNHRVRMEMGLHSNVKPWRSTKHLDLELRRPDFYSWFSQLYIVWPWACHLTCLILYCVTYTLGKRATSVLSTVRFHKNSLTAPDKLWSLVKMKISHFREEHIF